MSSENNPKAKVPTSLPQNYPKKVAIYSYQQRNVGLFIGTFGGILIGFGTENVLIALGCILMMIGISRMTSSLSHFY